VPKTFSPSVYVLICEACNKRYIGSTIHLRARITDHKGLLARGKHQNPSLQAHFEQFGEQPSHRLVVEIVAVGTPAEVRAIEEAMLVQAFRDERDALFNEVASACGFDSEKAREISAKRTPDEQSRRSRLGITRTTPEELKERARKRVANSTPESRRAAARKRLNGQSPDRLREIGQKGAFARRRPKLTDEEVLEIRARYKPGTGTGRGHINPNGYPVLARDFNISIATIQSIIERRTWRHLP
jgi:hypothetical protein